MSVPEEGATLYQRLAWASRQVGAVSKSGQAAQNQGGYAYRKIDDVLRALQPVLAAAQLVIVPNVLSWETEPWDGYGKPGWRLGTLVMGYTIFGPDGASVTMGAIGEAIDNSDKLPGKCASYAYKTFVSQLFCIPTDEPDYDNEWGPAASPVQYWWQEWGWQTQEAHDAERERLLTASKALPEEAAERLKKWASGYLQVENDLPLRDEGGMFAAAIAPETAADWQEKLQLELANHQPEEETDDE